MSVTATVENGTIKLPMHVPDGTKVEITLPEQVVSERQAPDHAAAPETDAAPIVGQYAWLNEFVGCIEGPSDMAAEHNHYAHGTPKRGDR